MGSQSIRILGIDPGLRAMGWGILEAQGSALHFVACGSVHTTRESSLGERLRQLHDGLAAIVAAHRPDEAAVEETFVNSNPQSALKLGQARGVAMLVPALAGLPVAEYAANVIKKTVVGAGHAEKSQIALMVRMLLPRCDPASADAADALAVAITHAQNRTARLRLAGMGVR